MAAKFGRARPPGGPLGDRPLPESGHTNDRTASIPWAPGEKQRLRENRGNCGVLGASGAAASVGNPCHPCETIAPEAGSTASVESVLSVCDSGAARTGRTSRPRSGTRRAWESAAGKRRRYLTRRTRSTQSLWRGAGAGFFSRSQRLRRGAGAGDSSHGEVWRKMQRLRENCGNCGVLGGCGTAVRFCFNPESRRNPEATASPSGEAVGQGRSFA